MGLPLFNCSPKVIRLVVMMCIAQRPFRSRLTAPPPSLPSISKTGASDAAVSANAKPAKFASVHANIHNHFSLERHPVDRQTYKERRSVALAEWQSLTGYL